MDLWSKLSCLAGTTLTTLGTGKAFDIVEVNQKDVMIMPRATGTVRPIKRKAIQDAFDEVKTQGSITLKGLRSFSDFNPVYVAAMLVQLPCITYTTRPINLKYIKT
jgi:hypothetical protein